MVYKRYFNTGPTRKPTAEETRKAQAFGKWGEETAVKYLINEGYDIIERNYRQGHLEIDIIAHERDTLVIVEVKTRSSDTFVRPEEAVNHKKRMALMRLANKYIMSHHITDNVRFDVITIVRNTQETKIEHLKEAFNIFHY